MRLTSKYILVNRSFSSEDELYHHGIKGMKWGIRRYQNRDGSLTDFGKKHLAENNIRTEENLVEKTIPKGTKMYRTTPTKDDVRGGKSVYVTYLEPDRQNYRSGTIVKTFSNAKDDSVYEHEFELKTDIRIPSLKETREVEKLVVSNEKRRTEVAKSLAKFSLFLEGHDTDSIREMQNISNKFDELDESGRKKLYDDVNKKYGERGDYLFRHAEEISNARSWFDTNDFANIESSLGGAHGVRDAIVKELQKRGYNAMYDNASIKVTSKGQYSKQQEGIEPLIIFDASTTLKKNNTSKVDIKDQIDSGEKYLEWTRQRDRTLKRFSRTDDWG